MKISVPGREFWGLNIILRTLNTQWLFCTLLLKLCLLPYCYLPEKVFLKAVYSAPSRWGTRGAQILGLHVHHFFSPRSDPTRRTSSGLKSQGCDCKWELVGQALCGTWGQHFPPVTFTEHSPAALANCTKQIHQCTAGPLTPYALGNNLEYSGECEEITYSSSARSLLWLEL